MWWCLFSAQHCCSLQRMLSLHLHKPMGWREAQGWWQIRLSRACVYHVLILPPALSVIKICKMFWTFPFLLSQPWLSPWMWWVEETSWRDLGWQKGGISTCLSFLFGRIKNDRSQALLAIFHINVVYFGQQGKSIWLWLRPSCDFPKWLTKFLSAVCFCNDKYMPV